MAVDKTAASTTNVTSPSTTVLVPILDDDGVWKHVTPPNLIHLGTAGDVDVTGVNDQDILAYDLATTKWVDRPLSFFDAFTTLSAAVAANTAALAALSSTGGILNQSNAVGTTLTNSTTDTSMVNVAANAAVPLASGDRLIFNVSFNVWNNTGSTVNISSLKWKVANNNTYQWNLITLPTGAGVRCCNLFCEFAQGTTSSNHVQSATLEIGEPNTNYNTVLGGPTIPNETNQAGTARRWTINSASSAADYGTTQPQMEVRFAFGTASTSAQMVKISHTLSLIKAP